MPDTLQILYTVGGVPYAKTVTLDGNHRTRPMEYIAANAMSDLLLDIAQGEIDAYTAAREETPAESTGT